MSINRVHLPGGVRHGPGEEANEDESPPDAARSAPGLARR